MKTISRIIAGTVMVAASFPLIAQADNGHHVKNEHEKSHLNAFRHSPLKVALWGDEFYSSDPAVKAILVEQTIESMNKHKLDFTIFAGATKNGSYHPLERLDFLRASFFSTSMSQGNNPI